MPDLDMPPALQSLLGLGDPVRVYRPGRAARLLNALACVAWALLGVGTGYFAYTYHTWASPQVTRTNVPTLYGIAALILGSALFWAWRIRVRWPEAAVVFRDGLAHYDGRQVRTFKWGELAMILMRVTKTSYYGIPTGTVRQYTITDRTGTRLKLDNSLAKVEDLMKQVMDGAYPHILARDRQAFSAGQRLQYGPISISRDEGVQQGKKRLAWSEIARVAVNDGTVTIKPKKGGLFAGLGASVAAIPNVYAFLAIVGEMAEREKAAGQAGQ
jgi:hypothetical protein